jgi:FkbM family methyltransferase
MKILTTAKRTVLDFVLKTLSTFKSQQVWEEIFLLSLTRMNYSNSGNYSDTGELFAANFIKERLKPVKSFVLFDVGANKGHYAKSLLSVFNSNATIYAFEPSQHTYKTLKENVSGIENIIPHRLGFSDKETSQTLFASSEESNYTSLYQRRLEHYRINMDQTEQVTLTTIDTFCRENQIERIHFLKLDIEGHELSALKGAKKMMDENKIDFIQFEFGGCNIDSRTFFQDFFYFFKDKYTIHRILQDGIFELPEYKESYEIFTNSNYLAIRK